MSDIDNLNLENFEKKSQKLIYPGLLMLTLIAATSLVGVISIMICCSPITSEPWKLTIVLIIFLSMILFFGVGISILITQFKLWYIKRLLKIAQNKNEKP